MIPADALLEVLGQTRAHYADGQPAVGVTLAAGPTVGHIAGASLRDLFAGLSLIGIKSNPELLRICCDVQGMTQQQAVASMAFQDAEAMIAARGRMLVCPKCQSPIFCPCEGGSGT